MTQGTREAIRALLMADAEATGDERAAVEAALDGLRVDQPVSARRAAELIGCHRNTVAKLVRARTLRTVRLPDGAERIVMSSIEEYIQGFKQKEERHGR